jgi:hypothetical protein
MSNSLHSEHPVYPVKISYMGLSKLGRQASISFTEAKKNTSNEIN